MVKPSVQVITPYLLGVSSERELSLLNSVSGGLIGLRADKSVTLDCSPSEDEVMPVYPIRSCLPTLASSS